MASTRQSEAAPQQCRTRDIKAWKADVESFFKTDWERLRSLMMQLEEHSWASDHCGEGKEVNGFDDRDVLHTVAVEASVPGSTVSGQRFTEDAVEDTGLKRHRLSKLAEQIEHRIRAANEGQR